MDPSKLQLLVNDSWKVAVRAGVAGGRLASCLAEERGGGFFENSPAGALFEAHYVLSEAITLLVSSTPGGWPGEGFEADICS